MRVLAETLFADAGFSRTLVSSAAVHLVLASLLIFGVGLPRSHSLPAPIFVDLVAAPPVAPRAPHPPRARPRQRVVQPVVIPRSQPIARKPKPKPKPRARPAPQPRTPPPPTADELLTQLREKVAARPESTESGAPPASVGRFDPLLARYQRRVLARLRANWTGARAFQRRAGLRVRYQVQLATDGALRGVTLAEGSGNTFFDESAERAIRRADPYPRPPRGELTLDLTFEPGGVF